jgi:hypothetical protein
VVSNAVLFGHALYFNTKPIYARRKINFLTSSVLIGSKFCSRSAFARYKNHIVEASV